MRKLIRRICKWLCKNIISIIALFLFTGICIVFKHHIIDNQLFIGVIGSIATLYFGIIKYQIENDKFRLELFKSFNDRYNGDMNDVFNSLENSSNILDPKINKELVIIDYFNLCAEEYYWYKNNRIPQNVWNAWKIGIQENLKKEGVQEIYNSEIKKFKGSYYGIEKEFPITE